MWVEVSVTWRDNDFAEEISGSSGLYFWRGKSQGWVKNKTPLLSAAATVPLPDYAKNGKVSLNFSSGTALSKNSTTGSIYKLIKERRPYTSYPEFRQKMSKDVPDNKITAVEKDKDVVLGDVLE